MGFMSQSKTNLYQCQDCNATSSKWQGRCFQCGAWESFVKVNTHSKAGKITSYAGELNTEVVNLAAVKASNISRVCTGWEELDRVLGGGLVPGSVSLLGGDPGVGKSTLLLQMLCKLTSKVKVLYVTGEESADQVALRARRLGLDLNDCYLLAHTDLSVILTAIKQQQAAVVVIDSIQTMASAELSSAAGSVSQVRECAMQLTQMAKSQAITILFIGHMTKDGHVAGPRVLEHMVDTVLYLEGEQTGRYRMLRASKNRFGSVHELGVFAMLEQGMREVKNPSLLFLSKDAPAASGSVIMACLEGSRVLLVELQTLVDDSYGQNPRRVVMGLDTTRMNMLMAILSKHAGVSCHNQDVFINVVGGLKITETAADLALCAAILSSIASIALPRDLMVIGELGLNGEIRPIQQGQARVAQAAKHGITDIILPSSNKITAVKGCRIHPVRDIAHAKSVLFELIRLDKTANPRQSSPQSVNMSSQPAEPEHAQGAISD